jgi:hypothetical protein
MTPAMAACRLPYVFLLTGSPPPAGPLANLHFSWIFQARPRIATDAGFRRPDGKTR